MKIESFNFTQGREISNKYIIKEKLGAGIEGEVYRIIEKGTQIERAAKFFFPHRNKNNKTAIRYARLLHDLSSCPLVIHYHTQEFIQHKGERVTCLVSEYVEGMLLSELLKRQPGHRLGIFRGLQLLHALISGLEQMHALKAIHGDLHTDNIIVKRYGLGFELKILDMHYWGSHYRVNAMDDICDSIAIFYEAIDGRKHYAKYPKEIKQICLGLKRTLIMKKFKNASQLRNYLENIAWESPYRER